MSLPKILESELKCGFCNHFWKNVPRILDCGHSVCESCCRNNLTKTMIAPVKMDNHSLSDNSNSSGKSSTFHPNHHHRTSNESNETDALSESDSGIFLSNISHASSGYSNQSDTIFNASIHQHGHSTIKPSNRCYHLTCVNCGFISMIPQQFGSSIEYFPTNLAIESLKNRYLDQINDKVSHNSESVSNNDEATKQNCQLCEYNPGNAAKVYCEQCQVYYCNECKEKCHPMRGPLESHKILSVNDVKPVANSTKKNYADSQVDVKQSKVILTKSLQRLSEKAKMGSDFIGSLKKNIDEAKLRKKEFLDQLDADLDQIVELVERKRRELHQFIDTEHEKKEVRIKDQINEGGQTITKATSMINMAAELIKEADPVHFINISDRLIKRSNRLGSSILYDLNELKPRFRTQFEFKLNTSSLGHEINKLELMEFQCPENPRFIAERCSVWDNLINVVWYPQGIIEVDRFILEIDDGNGGPFKTAYCGPENMCTIENLHFSSCYRLRIKAINSAGTSPQGDIIKLTTSSTAKFRMYAPPPSLRKPGISISKDGLELESTSSNTEEVVFMANTGFSKGVHYWEYLVEMYDGLGEPSFGVALENCSKNKKLGTDMFSWAMYLNSKRSWFRHQSEHSARTDVQLMAGHKIGVKLDMQQQRITFYYDGRIHGPSYFPVCLPNSVGPSRSYSHMMGAVGGCGSSSGGSSVGSSQSLNDTRTHGVLTSTANGSTCSGSSNSGSLINTPTQPQQPSSIPPPTSGAGCTSPKLLYPAVSISHGIKLRLVTGIQTPNHYGDVHTEEEMYNPSSSHNSLDDITTPSLTRRIDMTTAHILDGITTL